MAVAAKIPVRVLSDREPRGYVGPCCHSECADPATRIVELSVGGLIVTAWACDAHTAEISQ